MPRHGKRYRGLREKVEAHRAYALEDATTLVKELATAKFDETVEAHLRLGIDTRKSDQTVRGTARLPHGTGRSVRVLALTKGENVKAAEEAGADYVGGDDMIQKILEGWLDFDAVVATPDMMAAVGGKLGRLLGPRGLLPNPKSGTVGPDIAAMVRALKAGQIEFRNDKTGVLHAPIGKASFEAEKLAENFKALQTAVEATRPESTRGIFIRTVYLSSTMSPGVQVAI